MKHQQILDKLAARFLVQALDENFARAVSWGMLARKKLTPETENGVWEQIFNRWNCILLEDDPQVVRPLYKEKTILAMAILGHKYGLTIDSIRQQALNAIDTLNQAVALSDDFYHKSSEIKTFLQPPPIPLKRRPSMPENLTFFRPQDVIAIQYKKQFYAAYIHRDTGVNESPVLEFYDGVFEHIPTFEEVKHLPARGALYNDGITRANYYAVSHMKYLPDPANQVTLIKAAVDTPPSSGHLAEAIGAYQWSDIFTLQKDIENLFRLNS